MTVLLAQLDRDETVAQSLAQAHDRLRDGLTGMGNDGWDSTGATTTGSTAMARAKPPEKHIPTTPTPGPPHRSCSRAARARSQPVIGEDLSLIHISEPTRP